MADHKRIGLWVIAGLLAFMIMEKLFGDETEFEQLQDTCDEIKSANFKVQSSTKTKHNKICNSTKNIKHNKIYSSSKNMKRAKGQLNKLPKYSSLSHSENNKLNPRETKIGSVPVAEDMSSNKLPKYSSLSHSENNKLNPRDTKIGSVPVAEDMSSSNIK
uniref:Uncharacterized protein n=1 Tax=Biomphalaria glabrata TaxID=6526 RepID=A0A2C9L9X8_BIOGL